MSMRSVSKRWGRPGALSLLLVTLLPAGCAPPGAEPVTSFAVDFARSALAAWLL